jgi:hypothetical protein
MPFVSDIIPTPLLPPAYRGLHCQSLQRIVSINALRFARPFGFRNLPAHRAAGLSNTIAACQRGTQPQQTFPKVALAAAPYLFQNRLPFVQRTPAFSSYLRSLSARASALLTSYQLAISSFEQENSSLLFSVRYLVYQLATCQLATELQYSAHLPCSSVFLSLYQNAALPLFGSPTMPHRLEIQQHQLLCSSRSKEPKKKNITASTAPEHARSTTPKEI